jgi:hypothetical protein
MPSAVYLKLVNLLAFFRPEGRERIRVKRKEKKIIKRW